MVKKVFKLFTSFKKIFFYVQIQLFFNLKYLHISLYVVLRLTVSKKNTDKFMNANDDIHIL